MSNRIWMPLYWGDYHSKTQHLSTWQHGAYLLLIGAYWQKGQAIARANARAIARANDEQMGELTAILDEFFIEGRDGLLHNKRLDEELAKAQKISQVRKKAGKIGGSKSQANAIANAKQLPQQMPTQSQSQSHTSNKLEVAKPEKDFDVMTKAVALKDEFARGGLKITLQEASMKVIDDEMERRRREAEQKGEIGRQVKGALKDAITGGAW